MKGMGICMGLVILMGTSFAAQVKTVRNFDDIEITASITEPNNILLDDDRIQQIKAAGNTLNDSCNGKENCSLIDSSTGTLTFLPSSLYHTRPFTINILTEKGYFYNVRVHPKPVASQTILLKAYKKPVLHNHTPRNSSYEKMLVNFIRALVNGHLPEGFTQTLPSNPVIYKAPKTELKLLLTVTGNNLCGQIFELTNKTPNPMHVRESSFNWPKTKGIAVDKVNLAPYEKTRVYRIS